MPQLKKAELVEGVVYMPSPARLARHGEPHGVVICWLGHYRASTPGVIFASDATVRLDLDNEPQPDALLLIDPECGGQARISDDDYVENAPELVVEVSASTVSIDLHAKLNVYRRSGVREYLVWRVQDRAFDWFVLRQGRYVPVERGPRGFLESEVFPGLWLDANALLAGDVARVLEVVAQGTRSGEHAAFVARLRER
jgi:Uma2 family endonuclease